MKPPLCFFLKNLLYFLYVPMYNKELKQVDVDLMDMTNLQIMTVLTCVTTYQCFLKSH